MSFKKEIILKQTEDTKYILYALSKEEFEYMFFNQEKFEGTIISFGEPTQYDLTSIINFIPSFENTKKEKLENSLFYKCYSNSENNIIHSNKESFTHDTPLSSFYCAITLLKNPSYICIAALDLDETFNFDDFKNNENINEKINENNPTIKTNIFNSYDNK